jgi:hypothetical protein
MSNRLQTPLLIALLCALPLAKAFTSPASLRQHSVHTLPKRIIHQATIDEAASDDGGITDFSTDDIKAKKSTGILSDIVGDASTVDFAVEQEEAPSSFSEQEDLTKYMDEDVAKEMVLDAISGTSPDTFNSEARAFAGKDPEFAAAALTTDFLENPLTDDQIFANAETVEAILAVSQQAAEAADATLPAQVSESIPLIPVANFNDTMDGKPEILPAAKVVGPPATVAETFDYPSVKRIMMFAASATGVFLCSPLLSLIDTGAVGLLSGTAQQAALNPAVAVTDYAALLIVS